MNHDDIEYGSLEESLGELRSQKLQLQIEIDCIDEKISKGNAVLRRYEERKSELLIRKGRGVLKESEVNRIIEIREELEAMEAEKQVYTFSARGKLEDEEKKNISLSLVQEVMRVCSKNMVHCEIDVMEKGICGVIFYLISLIMDSKAQHDKAKEELEQYRVQLDEKNENFEQLALTLHRTRSEAIKKSERQKKENEDKISFLLTQLRSAEVHAQTNSSLIRKSLDKKMKFQRSSPLQVSYDDKMNVKSESKDSVSNLGFLRSRPHTAQSHISKGSNSTDATELITENDNLMGKYYSERERREVLEKRNKELVRELRLYRKELRKNDQISQKK